MNSLLVRCSFTVLVIALISFFILGHRHIQIDTNLNALNPNKVANQDLGFAINTLTDDINHRFIVVVSGSDEASVSIASGQMQAKLDSIQGLLVLTNETSQNAYLSSIAPYRFNFLTHSQQQKLSAANKSTASKEELATEAQRKLYQLGDGIRVIPFEQDPLGWFSDFLLSQVEGLEPESTGTSHFESFTVLITDYPENMASQNALYQAIKDIEHDVIHTNDVNVLHSGIFFFAVDSAQSAKGDIQRIAIGSIAGILFLMLLVFRSLLPLLLSLSSIAIGVGFGVLTSTLVFGSIHVLTIVFGASLIGIVVDYSLHYFYHFLSEKKQHNDKKLLRAMILSVITSLVGYGALGLSNLLILKKIALFSCSGLLLAWLSVMIFGPLIAKRPIVARQTTLMFIINCVQKVFASRPKYLASAGMVIGIASALFIVFGSIKTNDDPRQFFHVSQSLIAQEKEVSAVTQVFEPGRYLVVEGTNSDDIYTTLSLFYSQLGSHRQNLTSVLDWLPSKTTQEQNYKLQSALYNDGGIVDLFFQKLGMTESYSNDIKADYLNAKHHHLDFTTLRNTVPALPPLWIEKNDSVYSFVLIKKNSDLEKIALISQQIDNISYINSLGEAISALKDQRIKATKLLAVAYLLIAIMLFFYYRQLSSITLLLIPLVASLVTIASVAFIGQSVTVFHVMALFLVLGLGMDYIIFAKEMTDTHAVTQQAILLSAVTSLLSFGLLAFSSMPIVNAFGSTILIGNSINFIAAICLFGLTKNKRSKTQ
ncbi:MMPL family transporter [Alteromonas sp. 5E99-2]|uniref:MMPL family transporter n=1 Tax=Alteromonas sp. 5E99-2 TaxID=2817683 RepID=UPI001A985E7D|nr:MMPL family transporter [Alteromonas sp. 5E99-2]MBO1256752.1 MMPL family transporter [Alteromonas sp. 5E99-2]